MTDVGSTDQRTSSLSAAGTSVLPVVAISIFTAAALLFWVQPMVGKMVLPLLGGSPAVWTTALLFFQTALLCGYLYAHALGTLLPVRLQIAVHVTVVLLATLALPVAIPVGAVPDGHEQPVLWLIGLFMATVGLPYTVVAATSPLLQRWFALSGHRSAKDPYFLYVASNAGSLIGLLSYPFIAEPLIGVSTQSSVWTGGFVVLVALIATSGALIWKHVQVQAGPVEAQPKAPVTTFERIRWIALAFVPSSLLLGVTTHITTDIAAIPLLWAAPLSLYLITFMVAFAQKPLIPRALLLKIEWSTIILLSALVWLNPPGVFGIATHLTGFFIIAVARHSVLAEARPDATRLTEFYLWMSFGGALGGVFNAAIAPQIFNTVLEYPLAIVAAAATRLLVPGALKGAAAKDDVLLTLAAALAAVAGAFALSGVGGSIVVQILIVLPIILVAYVFNANPIGCTVAIGIMFAALQIAHPNVRYEGRSFFGAYRVITADEGRYVEFAHGTTIHGAQASEPARHFEPLAYYTAKGPFGQAMKALQSTHEKLRLGVVGLGIGGSVCYSRPGDTWTLYEIDPLVVHIAKDSGHFSFLNKCVPTAQYKVGDARISLAREPNGVYDVLILDAYTSDSIPMHLVTREAMALVRTKLAPGGVVLFNISNRYLKLEPVVAKAAEAAGMVGIAQFYAGTSKKDHEPADASQWLALAVDPADLNAIAASGHWRQLKAGPTTPLWTDDFSNLVGVVSFNLR